MNIISPYHCCIYHCAVVQQWRAVENENAHLITELHKDDIFTKIAVHHPTSGVHEWTTGEWRWRWNGRIMNGNFSENIENNRMRIFVFNATGVNVLLNLIWEDANGYLKEG